MRWDQYGYLAPEPYKDLPADESIALLTVFCKNRCIRRHLFVDDYRQQQDAIAAQKWYLHLLVYRGKFKVKGIFDENGNPVKTQLPKLIDEQTYKIN